MEDPFEPAVKSAADDMGVALYQRFTLTEASLFLRCRLVDLQRLVDNSKLEYIKLTNSQTEFFGYQLIQYLLTSVSGAAPLLDSISEGSDLILRANDVHELTGLSRTTIWRMERKGQFPARVPLSVGSVGWRKSEVDEWIRTR